ncbi:MAG: Dihydrofolate reductase [uncultured Thermomicrobiales bacterium]|uniref:Dihydrofolate reductase n=1 Tax=uncultured Thermomicrobiales bacterium TaxID=1645740 RepID=A0A6J4V2T5_9BACT|nr:MAG: Dihydrofolate reductase [uncultured Thermomicrobiales bacterium]
MGKLIYAMITSLDGFVSNPDGNFGWGAPEEESHEFINQLMRSIGTHLYGRRMYETMVYWETLPTRSPTSGRSSWSTRGSGGQRTKLSTPQR